MLDWQLCQICHPLEIKLLLLKQSRYHDLPKRIGTDLNGPKRTSMDTETDSLITETDRNETKGTFVNTETDSVGTKTLFWVLK